MNASKENCKKARKALNQGSTMSLSESEHGIWMPTEAYQTIREFLEVAEKKLPYEKSFPSGKKVPV